MTGSGGHQGWGEKEVWRALGSSAVPTMVLGLKAGTPASCPPQEAACREHGQRGGLWSPALHGLATLNFPDCPASSHCSWRCPAPWARQWARGGPSSSQFAALANPGRKCRCNLELGGSARG